MTRFPFIHCTALLFLCAGCVSEIRVAENTIPERRLYGVADYSAGTLSNKTVNLLGNFILGKLFQEDPAAVLAKLEQLYQEDKRSDFVAALADAALQAGYRFQKIPSESSRFFLASALYSAFFLTYLDEGRELYNEERIRQIRIHNLAMTELFSYLKTQRLERRSGFALPMPAGSRIRQVRFTAPRCDLPVSEDAIADFTPCAHYNTIGLTHDTRVFGLGVPLIAELKPGCRDVGGQLIDGLPIAVTLVGHFEPNSNATEVEATFHFVYSRTKETISFGSKTFPLAADFSTPLARIAGRPQEMNFIERTVKVSEASRITGLYHFEPYDETRIPVVFVHGLMSDARTWCQMLNTLLSDRELRRKYQFLGFAYSSGNPIFVSASNLRRALLSLREALVKQKRSTEKFDQMVLIGHSMGGLLSRLQISECSREKVFAELNIKDPEALKRKLTKQQDEKISALLDFAPLSFIARVIFIAVPHRGSDMATSWYSRLGASLIRLPGELVRRNIILAKELLKLKEVDSSKLKGGTGIDNLRPDNTMLKVLNRLEIKKSLPCHSIIGNQKERDVPGGSDGIVPYASSHLDNASSELVVRSGHSVHRNALAIQEVRRILLLHIQTPEKKK